MFFILINITKKILRNITKMMKYQVHYLLIKFQTFFTLNLLKIINDRKFICLRILENIMVSEPTRLACVTVDGMF